MKNTQFIKPFFPLGIFLVPGEDSPVRIFEPKYLQLIEEVNRDESTFVIPYVNGERMTKFGCEVKIQQIIAESIHGNKVIVVESVGLVKVTGYFDEMTGGRLLMPRDRIQPIFG